MTTELDIVESREAALAPRMDANGAIVHAQTPSIEGILAAAVERDMTPEALEKLVALYERLEGRKAEQAFNVSIAAFKAECPPVVRRTENSQFTTNDNGIKRVRRYASLEDIERTIREPLGRHGLSYRWGSAEVTENMLHLECIVSHEGGHSVASRVTLPYASKAGCSDQQKMGAAMTYAQRYSLIAALGLTSCDEDVDGNDPQADQPITADQAANLQALADEVNADMSRFLDYFDVQRVEDLPSGRFKQAIGMLERKRGRRT